MIHQNFKKCPNLLKNVSTKPLLDPNCNMLTKPLLDPNWNMLPPLGHHGSGRTYLNLTRCGIVQPVLYATFIDPQQVLHRNDFIFKLGDTGVSKLIYVCCLKLSIDWLRSQWTTTNLQHLHLPDLSMARTYCYLIVVINFFPATICQ